MAGLTAALSLQNLAFALIGCVLGTLIGVLPGLGPAAGTAILIPLTFKLDPTGALIMLSAIYYGAMYGGTMTSVLINVPGEAASVVTCIDGHQMAKQGRGGTALGIAAIGSFVGGIVATIALVVVAPPLAQVALKFGPPEFFALMLVGLCLITGLGGRSLLAGLTMAMLGLLIAMVGIDPVRGAPRFTLGIPSLYDGLGFIPVVMGLFGVAEILLGIEQPRHQVIKTEPRLIAAFARGVAPLYRRHRTRDRHRLFPRAYSGCRGDHSDLRGVCLREAPLEDAGAVWARRHRRRGGTRERQQRLRQCRHDSAADPRHPKLADDCGADGRVHHQRAHARGRSSSRSARILSGP